MENVQQDRQGQDLNKTLVTLSLAIGEISAIFGVINAGAFQGVMISTAQKVDQQIRAHNISITSQREAQSVIVNVTLELGEVNTILSIISNSAGFASIMTPIVDKITSMTQGQIENFNEVQQAAPQLIGQLPNTLSPN